MKKTGMIAALLICGILVLAGCGAKEKTEAQEAESQQTEAQETAAQAGAEAETKLDSESLQELFDFAASFGGSAGSGLKSAVLAVDSLEWANTCDLQHQDPEEIQNAMKQAIASYSADEQEVIRSNFAAARSDGDSFFSNDDLTIDTFENAGVLERAQEQTEMEGSLQNFNAFFDNLDAVE